MGDSYSIFIIFSFLIKNRISFIKARLLSEHNIQQKAHNKSKNKADDDFKQQADYWLTGKISGQYVPWAHKIGNGVYAAKPHHVPTRPAQCIS